MIKNKIKRCLSSILCGLLTVAMLFAFSACNSDSNTETQNTSVYDQKQLAYYEYGSHLSDVSFTEPKKYDLWQGYEYTPFTISKKPFTPSITAYLVGGDTARGCVIITPGGGYAAKSADEGAPIAEYINEHFNMSAFVVDYRVTPYDYNAILQDELRAIRFVRYFAEDFNVDSDKICVLGFSAGGHLALMSGEHFDSGKQGDAIDAISSRPDAVALCYPVVTFADDRYVHNISRTNFLGKNFKSELKQTYSGELGVSDSTPSTFICHAEDDTTVNIQNSKLLAAALAEKNVEVESHWFANGGHGFALGNNDENKTWTTLFETWLTARGW